MQRMSRFFSLRLCICSVGIEEKRDVDQRELEPLKSKFIKYSEVDWIWITQVNKNEVIKLDCPYVEGSSPYLSFLYFQHLSCQGGQIQQV